MKTLLSYYVLLLGAFSAAHAAMPLVSPVHPMPNTVISVSAGDDGVTLLVAVPLPELRLAMQREWPEGAGELEDAHRAAIADYFSRHVTIRSIDGIEQPWQLQTMTVIEETHEDVGRYQELRLRLLAPAREGLDPRHFELGYDAVIHQIPNHYAVVQLADQVGTGDELANGRTIGVIRYDFRRNLTPVLHVETAAE